MVGLIGKKIGMTQVFDATGKLIPVTVIKIEDNVVIEHRTVEKNGYNSCVLGSFDKKASRVTKPYAGQFTDVCDPKKTLVEIRDFEVDAAVGDVLGVDLFKDIAFVDVVGTSKGKGFQGVVKRYGFRGGRGSHGSKFHRGIGGTGQSATPSRTFKGRRMAGRMGGDRVTVQNLRVVKVDEDKRVLLVKGAVPGPSQSVVIVQKAKKK